MAVRLTVSCQRPASGLRCNGLGPWTGVLTFLAWLSVPINVGMIALATQQLDIYFDPPLPPFEKLLCAVVAEHVLLAAKFAVQFAMDSGDLDDQAGEAAEAQRRHYLRGVHGLTGVDDPLELGYLTLSPMGTRTRTGADAHEQEQPRLISVFPASGPCASGTVATIRGERLGLAIARGEVLLRLHMPRATMRAPRSRGEPLPSTITLSATFVSDRKLTCVLPPSECTGRATIELLHPDNDWLRGALAKGGESASKPHVSPKRGNAKDKESATKDGASFAAASVLAHEGGGNNAGSLGVGSLSCIPSASVPTPSGAGGGVQPPTLGMQISRSLSRDGLPAPEDGTCRFLYYSAFKVQRLKPNSGPLVGGTPVRVLGSGFVETNEITCSVRLGGVERCIPAVFVSETELRILTPSFTEVGAAKVTLALNGHDFDPDAEPLCFQYQPAPLNCAVQ